MKWLKEYKLVTNGKHICNWDQFESDDLLSANEAKSLSGSEQEKCTFGLVFEIKVN